jgi:hypothetical protein
MPKATKIAGTRTEGTISTVPKMTCQNSSEKKQKQNGTHLTPQTIPKACSNSRSLPTPNHGTAAGKYTQR